MNPRMAKIKRLLIANRGEIACRIIRTARRMNIETMAIYSGADRNAMHVKMADQAHQVGEYPEPQRSYLRQDRIVEIAQKYQAGAIHPGYGFLSESAEFAQRCHDEQILFVGPSPGSIRTMGIKNESKRIMIEAGVPVVPGYHGDNQDDQLLLEEARKIGYPVMIKPVRGGGGKGMRVVHHEANFFTELESSRRESLKSFNDQSMLLEKFIENPRHIEVQVFGDTHGNHVYLFERDCSVQRRHQKIIEEAPAPLLPDQKRRELGEKAVAAAKAVDYVGAGTVEFIVDKQTDEFYFMEMNTRLQVEHPITEMITGTDLVEWQLRVASGEQLPLSQSDIKINGHAFEARIYAESPSDNFLPQTGRLRYIALPRPLDALDSSDLSSSAMRLDTGVTTGDHISPFYDPMIAKLVCWAQDRQAALDKLSRALSEYVILGVPTNISFLHRLATNEHFQTADVGTDFIDLHLKELFPSQEAKTKSLLAKSEIVTEIGAFVYSILAQSGICKQVRQSGAQFHPNDLNSFRMIGQPKPIYEFNKVRLGESLPNVELRVTYQSYAYNSGRLSIFLENQTEASYEGDVEFAEQTDAEITVTLAGQEGSFKHKLRSPILSDHQTDETTRIIENCSLGLSEPITTKWETHFKLDRDGSFGLANPLVACAPMPGIVEKILVNVGDNVECGQSLLILSAMKMEYTIKSASAGRVTEVRPKVGSFVAKDSTLIRLDGADGT